MKKLLAAAMLVLLSTAALAEGPQGPVGILFSQLDLSDEQKTQIQELRKNGATLAEMRSMLTSEQLVKLDELRKQEPRGKNLGRMQENLELSDEQVEQIRTILEEDGTREEINEILTYDQVEKLKQEQVYGPGKGGKGKVPQ